MMVELTFYTYVTIEDIIMDGSIVVKLKTCTFVNTIINDFLVYTNSIYPKKY